MVKRRYTFISLSQWIQSMRIDWSIFEICYDMAFRVKSTHEQKKRCYRIEPYTSSHN
jgi:hypothetical protein